jgi:hypothetical protein
MESFLINMILLIKNNQTLSQCTHEAINAVVSEELNDRSSEEAVNFFDYLVIYGFLDDLIYGEEIFEQTKHESICDYLINNKLVDLDELANRTCMPYWKLGKLQRRITDDAITVSNEADT